MAGEAFTCPNSNPRTQPGKESLHVGEGENQRERERAINM